MRAIGPPLVFAGLFRHFAAMTLGTLILFFLAGGAATFQLFLTFGRDGHRLVDRVDL